MSIEQFYRQRRQQLDHLVKPIYKVIYSSKFFWTSFIWTPNQFQQTSTIGFIFFEENSIFMTVMWH